MSLRLAGSTGVQELLDRIEYNPGLQDSGDLEAGTKTITAISKQATADYTTNPAVASPPARLTVTRLGLRLQVTIDSFNAGATQLNYGVTVNGTERKTGSWTIVGAQYAVVDLTVGQFNLGSANTMGVFLWVNAGNAVVSVCCVWLAVGTTDAVGWGSECLRLEHTGFAQFAFRVQRIGTGTFVLRLMSPYGDPGNYEKVIANTVDTSDGSINTLALVTTAAVRPGNQSVATDILAMRNFACIVRRVE